MEYRVIRKFRDLQDEDHVYREGDWYPRRGEVDEARAAELMGADNKIGVPLIEPVQQQQQEQTESLQKDQQSQVSVSIDLNDTVDNLKNSITAELNEAELLALLAAETADKNRKGVVEHIQDLLSKVGE